MTFLEKLNKYRDNFSYTSYRFNKISNFLTFEQYVDEQVKKYAESLINQPTLNCIYDRCDKKISLDELNKLKKENVYDPLKIKTKDNRYWSVPPASYDSWLEVNNFNCEDIVSVELNQRGYL